MIQELSQLGLTYGEARVYLSLLKIGSSKVGAIVRESHVSYSKIYDVLERLSMKGLVSHVTIGEVKHFNAVEPYRLQDYIQRKEEQLNTQKEIVDQIVPSLIKIANNKRRRNSAEIFVGDRGLRTAYEILLSDASKHEVLRYFYPYDDEYHDIASPFYARLYQFQKSKQLEERGVSVIDFKKSNHYKQISSELGVKLRFVHFPLPGTMDIFKDRLLIISWSSKTGILISSREIVDHFKEYFDSVWNIAER
jgi:sugar-specific transcriptional regulator TrmB